jgi:hypothetical protein
MKHTNTLSICRMQNFSTLKQVVYTEPLGFNGVNKVIVCGPDSFRSGQGPAAASCEHGNKPSKNFLTG